MFIKQKHCFSTMKRGQVSLEYMILMAFITLIIAGILGIAVFYTGGVQHGVRSNQVQEFAHKITSTAEYIYYSGEPSKATITAYVPEGVTNITIVENSLVISHWDTGGLATTLFPCNVNISGTLHSEWGVKTIELVATENEVVIGHP